MDIPYKGYTITPNSARQPDGRWLPVAELETSHRGEVTTQPPFRATSREMRANRADADAAAVQMAKAWIDANERESVTIGASTRPAKAQDHSTTAGPRAEAPIASEVPARAQERRAEAAPRPKVASDKKRPVPSPSDKLSWARLYQAIGLDSDEKMDRVARVLVVHSVLDRLVTLVLVSKLASEKTLEDIAPLPISTRLDLGSALGVVAPGVAESILEVDRVRDRLIHFKPTRGKRAWDVSDVEEIASPDAFDKCTRRGIEAVQNLMSALRVGTNGAT